MQMDAMHKITIEEMSKIGINIADPNQKVGTMSGGQGKLWLLREQFILVQKY